MREQQRPSRVKADDYAGQWVAWNGDHSEVIASGDDAIQVEKEAIALGKKYSLDKIPSLTEHFAGSAILH